MPWRQSRLVVVARAEGGGWAGEQLLNDTGLSFRSPESARDVDSDSGCPTL